jgi:hypothetical protein
VAGNCGFQGSVKPSFGKNFDGFAGSRARGARGE